MLSWLVVAAAWAGTCETEWIGQTGKRSPVCAELQKLPAVTRQADGTLSVNPLSFARQVPAELRRPVREASRDEGRLKALRDQFNSLRDSMIAQVTNGAAEGAWNTHQRYLVSRLREARLSFEFHSDCTRPDESANGHYSQVENVVRLCPLYSHMSPQSALGIMAHELGHLADPCNYADRFHFGADLKKLNTVELPRALNRAAASCLANTGGLPAYQNFLQRPSVSGSGSVVLYPFQTGSPRELTERLVSCGHLTAPAVPAPRTYEGSPFLSLISCVAKNFRNPGGNAAAGREVTSASPIGEQLCAGHTHTKECQADHLGMAAFHKYLRDHSSVGPDALFYMRMNHCLDRGVVDPKSEYPSSDERLRLLFGSPEAQKLANCHLTTPAKCPPQKVPGSVSESPEGVVR